MRSTGWGRSIELLLIALGLGACASAATTTAPPVAGAEARASAYMDSLRERPPYLKAFLRRMPKGGDLHNHLSGAIYAESFVRWAADDGLCVDQTKLALVPCQGSSLVPVGQAIRDEALYSKLIDALSMRNFLPLFESGHDHFFNTFAKFGAAQGSHFGDMLAEVADRAGGQSVSYLELMVSPGMTDARKIGAAVGWDEDMSRMREKVLAGGMVGVVASARRQIDAAEQSMKRRLRCAEHSNAPGCDVTVRYLAQVIRIFPPEQVFAQCVLAYELAKADPRIVGLNLVAPEDDPTTLRDYDKQMRMLAFLHSVSPEVKLSLHAGEVTADLVPPDQLRGHIRGAVEVAAARRIGHGVDILGEDNSAQLMTEMAQKRILVEINLTSNDVILNVYGARHPFETYRRYGVPLALSTDDEGVSRIDLTNEYERAVLTYRLSYGDLKTLARNSLEYAFLPGESLWKSSAPYVIEDACAGASPSGTAIPSACSEFLAHSEKAKLQWELEAQFASFEALPWPQH